MPSVPAAVTRALEAVRSNGRVVAWTPAWMGFGNVLLLAMWAHEGRAAGEPRWILANGAASLWVPEFPRLGSLVLTRDQVRFTDQRVMPWSEAARARGAFGATPPHQPLDIAQVERFVSEVLVPGSAWADLDLGSVDPNRLVVNVRRGDYYSDPEIRAQYGFDVRSYLRVAVERSIAQDGLPTEICVVSDDLDWCRGELGWLGDIARVDWAGGHGPVNDFKVVSSARRAVITNSTFSYWAAHVGNVLHGDNHAQVWAPRFFDRTQNGGRSWLLDERWSVIEGLDDGWDEHQEPNDVVGDST